MHHFFFETVSSTEIVSLCLPFKFSKCFAMIPSLMYTIFPRPYLFLSLRNGENWYPSICGIEHWDKRNLVSFHQLREYRLKF